MAKKLFIGNLNWHATEDGLRELFEQYGEVSEVIIITDRDTGRSKGFGFVSYDDDTAADNAVAGLHGTPFMERDLVVNEARPKERF